MLKLISSEYSVFMFLLEQQPGAKCLGNDLTGTFSLKRQSWRDLHSSMPRRMILGPQSLSEGQKADETLLKYQVEWKADLFCSSKRQTKGIWAELIMRTTSVQWKEKLFRTHWLLRFWWEAEKASTKDTSGGGGKDRLSSLQALRFCKSLRERLTFLVCFLLMILTWLWGDTFPCSEKTPSPNSSVL